MGLIGTNITIKYVGMAIQTITGNYLNYSALSALSQSTGLVTPYHEMCRPIFVNKWGFRHVSVFKKHFLLL